MTEAYELLGAEIGESLSLNGIHGTSVVKIAEKFLIAKAEARAGFKALEGLGGAKALELTPDSLLVLTDPNGEFDERTIHLIKNQLKVKILVLPDAVEIELVGDAALERLVINLLKTFPQLHKPVRDLVKAEENTALRKCVEAMHMQLGREDNQLFISQPTARAIWDEAIAEAEKQLL